MLSKAKSRNAGRKLYFLVFILFLTAEAFPQWVQTNGPYGGGYVYDLLVSETNLFASAGGGLFCSTDYGTSWTRLDSVLSNPYHQSLAITPNENGGNNIFTSTWGNGIFRSTDDGVTWFAVNSGLASPYISGLVAGSFGTEGISLFASTFSENPWGVNLFRSIDNGESWIQINTELLWAFFKVLAVNESSVFVGGDWGSGLQRFTKIDTNWVVDTLIIADGTTSVFSLALDGTNIFVGTFGRVLISTDNGTNWNEVELSINNAKIYCLFILGTNIFAGSERGVFLSTNGGTSWTEANSGFSQISGQWHPYIFDFDIIGTNIFAGTEYGVWSRSWAELVPVELVSFTASASGKEVTLSWTTVTELNNQGFEVQRKFSNNDFVTIGSVKGHGITTSANQYSYVDKLVDAGKYFYRLKQVDFSGTFEYSNEIEVEVRALDKFTLEQNFPNPFNPTTTIGYVLQEKSNARLTLLNTLGEEIAVLVNEEQDKGYHKVEFSAKGGSASGGNGLNLTSGVYFYKLVANDFVSVKKMMLVK